MPGALSDIRVVEVGTLLAGPFCGQQLADHGAEVIKVEPPTGDPMRAWGQEMAGGKSLWWPVVGRGKKSVTINLREPAGQDLVRRLCKGADVLLENFRPGTLERWGLAPEGLRAANPRLIVTRVSGYGQTGPYAAQPGFGAVGEAIGGIRYTTGDPSSMPSRTGISIGDTLTAMFATIGTLNALHARERTGRGQVVDAALYESVLAVMESLLTEYHVAGFIRERTGSIIPNIAPANAYPTRDGKIHLISGNQDTVWRRLAEAMGRPKLGTDPRYATHIVRGEHQQELDENHRGMDRHRRLRLAAPAPQRTRRPQQPDVPGPGDAGRRALRRSRSHRLGGQCGLRVGAHAERRAPPVRHPRFDQLVRT